MNNRASTQRKFKLILVSLGVILAGFFFAGYNEALAGLYATLCTCIIGLNTVYGGANVGTKWVANKKTKESEELDE